MNENQKERKLEGKGTRKKRNQKENWIFGRMDWLLIVKDYEWKRNREMERIPEIWKNGEDINS